MKSRYANQVFSGIRATGATALVGVFSMAGLQPAAAQSVDTSEWICEFCPFETGYRGDYDVGTTVVSDDSAWFGNATGYDEEGAYLNLSGNGSYVTETLVWDWTADELGLDSRSATAGVRRPGSFEVDFGYSELPRREFITTQTIFQATPSGTLALPDDWTRAGSTQNFVDLEDSLSRRDIESDRSVFEAGGSYLATGRFLLSADFRQQRRTGNNILGGSYFSTASLLPVPFVYETDEVDVAVAWTGDRGSLSASWYLSDFQSGGDAFGWQSPFTTAPGAEFAELAQPPDNRFQQLSLTGGYRFDTLASFVRFSLALGRIEQDARLLRYTTNDNLNAGQPPRTTLDGEVDTTRLAFTAGARPLPGARVDFSASFDERDNGTPRETWTRVIGDTFLSGDPELNNPYSYERTRVDLSGSYDLIDSVRLMGGIEYRKLERDLQEVASQDEVRGWGGVRWQAMDDLTLQGEFGTSSRDIDRYDEDVAQSFGQNPILRKYNLAYRYREAFEVRADGAFAEGRFGWSVNATLTDDAYAESPLGLISGDETIVAGELNWSASPRSTFYVHGGFETIESVQLGSESFAAPDWRAQNEDEFITVGAGFRIRQIAEKFDIEVNGLYSDGATSIDMQTAANGASRFPDAKTTMEYLSARVSYDWSERLDIAATVGYQHFDADEWALDGLDEATLPQVLSLGADPWDEEQFIVGLSFRYNASPSGDGN